MTTVKTKPQPPQFKWQEGKTYICTHAASPGYRVGEKYLAYKNEKGYVCLMGSDGCEDICTMLVSSFKMETE